jgi:hypothetical protein
VSDQQVHGTAMPSAREQAATVMEQSAALGFRDRNDVMFGVGALVLHTPTRGPGRAGGRKGAARIGPRWGVVAGLSQVTDPGGDITRRVRVCALTVSDDVREVVSTGEFTRDAGSLAVLAPAPADAVAGGAASAECDAARVALEQAATLRFRDRDGTPIWPGSLVHYVPVDDPDDPPRLRPGVWTEQRWGVVVGLMQATGTSGPATRIVRVHAVSVTSGPAEEFDLDAFGCGERNLVVIDGGPLAQAATAAGQL